MYSLIKTIGVLQKEALISDNERIESDSLLTQNKKLKNTIYLDKYIHQLGLKIKKKKNLKFCS